MAADILLYDANFVPVGKDQLQHLEITRKVGAAFNHQMGVTFVIPEAMTSEETMYVPGIDGNKMSKSRGNTIDIFQTDKKLRKNCMRIQTDSTPLEDPKDPGNDNVYALYKLIATPEEVAEMEKNYREGGYGYGHAKQALYEVITREFGEVREKFNYYMEHPEEVEEILLEGAKKAATTANETLSKVRTKLGY